MAGLFDHVNFDRNELQIRCPVSLADLSINSQGNLYQRFRKK